MSDYKPRFGKVASMTTGVLVLLLFGALVYPRETGKIVQLLCVSCGAVVLLSAVIYSTRFFRLNLLKLLLRNRSWAYHPRAYWTKVYLALCGVLGGPSPRLFELQFTLPPLPLPSLENTIRRYLTTLEPLLTADELAETRRKADAFVRGEGRMLQQQLQQQAKTTDNWLIRYWEDVVYLRSRLPLCVYSNWYGLDRVDPFVRSQFSRVAHCVYRTFMFKELVESGKLAPNRAGDAIPLCMHTYTRIFGTVRIPKLEQDELQTFSGSTHVVVICNERYFRLEVRGFTPAELRVQFQRIADQAYSLKTGPSVAALTSQNRDVWAKQRQFLINYNDLNKQTLEEIETAAFIVCLDDSSPTTVEEMAHLGVHRHGKAIWFDKNFNMIVCKNGRLTSNVDHTWADANVLVHVFDYVFQSESSVDSYIDPVITESPRFAKLKVPVQLEWRLNDELLNNIAAAKKHLFQLQNAQELVVLKFQTFGKRIVKQCGLSPDAFCQMALQLAFYKTEKHTPLTYETGGTVRFLKARTETVRSASNESKAFVMAMMDTSKTNEERYAALKAACTRHVKTMRAATNGDGVDRHLLVLRILSTVANQGTPNAFFLDKGWQLDYELSSSQTTAVSTLGGGFAPLCAQGYGASYVVAEDRIWFHISSFTQAPTSSHRFADNLREALLEMQSILSSGAGERLTEQLTKRKITILNRF